jgi:hypothetical protein
MKFSQGLFRMSGKRSWSQFVLAMPFRLSPPTNTTSSGRPAGKKNILDLMEDLMQAQHSSLLTLCTQQKAWLIFSIPILPLAFFERVA